MEGLMNPACIKQEPVQHEEHEAVLADMACGAIEIGPIKIELPETECHKNNMKVQRNKQSPVKKYVKSVKASTFCNIVNFAVLKSN